MNLSKEKKSSFDDQVSRDHTAKQEEKKGTIRFQLIHNSLKHKPSDDHLLWMLEIVGYCRFSYSVT